MTSSPPSPTGSDPEPRREWSPLRTALLDDGYVVIPGLLDRAEVASIRASILQALGAGKGVVRGHGKVDPVAGLTMATARRTIIDPRIREAAASLLGAPEAEFLLHCDVHRNDFSDWHKDTGETVLPGGYFGGPTFDLVQPAVVKFAIYCEDHRSDDAGFHVQPGTHRNANVESKAGLVVRNGIGDVVCFDVRVTHRGERKSRYHYSFDKAFRHLGPRRAEPITAQIRQLELRARRRVDRTAMFFSFGIPGALSESFARTNWERARSQAGLEAEVPYEVFRDLSDAGVAFSRI